MSDIELTKEDHRIIRLALITVRARAYGLNYSHSMDEIDDELRRLARVYSGFSPRAKGRTVLVRSDL